MSSHMSGRILFLFRLGQRRVRVSRFLVNSLSSSRAAVVKAAVKTVSISEKKTLWNGLRVERPSGGDETGYKRLSGAFSTCMLDNSSSCSWMCCVDAAPSYTHVADSCLCGVEEWTRPCENTLNTGFCVSPCAIFPHGIAYRTLQQFVRRSSTKTSQSDAKAGEKKRQSITEQANAKKAGRDKPQGTQETEPGGVNKEEKPSDRSAGIKKILQRAPGQKGNAEPGKKERSRKAAAGKGEKEGNPISNIPTSPESLFQFRYSRSSKPGGSSSNKSETKVALHVPLKALEDFYGVSMEKLAHDPRGKVNKKGELIITSEKHASQALNKKECMQKLDDMLTSLHEMYFSEEQKTPYVIDEETQKKYKFNILVRKKKEQYHRKCNQVNARDL